MNALKQIYKKLISIAAAAGTLMILSACAEPAQTWNPSFVSLTPKPTQAAEPSKEATPIPAPETLATPEPEATPELTPTPEATPTPEPTKAPAMTKDDFKAVDFFNDAVFVGDSVLSHFYLTIPIQDKETFGTSKNLTVVSYSVREALKEESDIHPMYQGERRQVWETMKLMDAKRVLLFFGLNDIGVSGVEGFVENYKTLVANIKEAVPEAKVYIISISPMRADKEGTRLNNAKITEANGLIKEYAQQEGIGYIDVATMLLDENGAMNTEYSDGETNVHLNKKAYLMWKDVLADYAKEELLAEYEAANGLAE